jgi:ABC-type glycerol-3-phosphate transport system permease component
MTSIGWRIAKLVAVLVIVVWSLGPIVIGVTTSISTQREVNDIPTRWVPAHPTLNAYRALLEGTSGQRAGGTVTEAGTFSRSLWNSTVLAIVSTAVILVVSTMAAYAFGRLRFRFGAPLFAVLVGTIIIPIFVVVVALFKLMADAHLIDTKRGLVMVFVATLTPLATWLLYAQVQEMPTEPEEAALIDGCRRWQAFVRVVVPQMGSGIVPLTTTLPACR